MGTVVLQRRSDAMPWYDGPALLEHLESVALDSESAAAHPFRLPVQLVINKRQKIIQSFGLAVAPFAQHFGDS